MSAASPDQTRLIAVIITVVSRLHSARRAAQSFVHHNPTSTAKVVVVDDWLGEAREALCSDDLDRLDVLFVDEIEFNDNRELFRLALAWEPEELWRALRPVIVRSVLRRGRTIDARTAVIVLPDDSEVECELDELVSAAMNAPAVLVATRCTAVPRDGRLPDATAAREHGIMDPDLVVVGPQSDGFLDWWGGLVERSPAVSPARMRPPSEPWFDQAPTLFDVHVSRDPALGVSYLNADEPGRLDDPKIIRYLGFDVDQPWRFSNAAQEWPRVLLSEHPKLAGRCRARANDLSASPTSTDDRAFSRWNILPSGAPVDAAMRVAYLHGLVEASGRDAPEPPNGFVEGEEAAFVDWLNEPLSPEDTRTRYLAALQSIRPDLWEVGQGPLSGDALGAWARITGRADGLWWKLIPADPEDPLAQIVERATGDPASSGVRASSGVTDRALPTGVNVVGLFKAELGVGAAGRLLLKAVIAAGVPYSAVVDTATVHSQRHELSVTLSESNPYSVNLIALNADSLPGFARRVGPKFFAGRRTVGLWFWEVEQFPERFAAAFDLIDEVWVASEHVRAAIAGATSKPVFVIPLGVDVDDAGAASIDPIIGVGADRYCFLQMFDYASVAERKNPFGAVEAFRRAFPEPQEDGPVLICKSISGDFHLLERERLRALTADRPDIVLVEKYLTPQQTQALVVRSNALVSLHRAEGWGLSLADAMSLGKPVIATGYSGNLAYMNDTNSWLVPYTLVDIPDAVATYAGCGRWADPDLDAAAMMLRSVHAGGPLVAARARQGAADLALMAASDAGAQFVRNRLHILSASEQGDDQRESAAVNYPDNTQSPEVAMIDSASGDNEHESADARPTASIDAPLEHEGLGPIVLNVDPVEANERRSGIAGRVVTKYTESEFGRLDGLGHARTAALVDALQRTRSAIVDVTTKQRADQDTLTRTLTDVVEHLQALQSAHDSLVRDQGELHQERRVAEAALATRLRSDTADLKADLTRIETQLAALTHAVERLTAASRPQP